MKNPISGGRARPRPYIIVVFLCWLLVVPAFAQNADPVDVPDLTETFEGSGRLNGLSFDYPDGWHTLEGIPVSRLVSFNIISSVQIGLRNQVEPGEEAIVFAVAGGRVDRWPSIETAFTPEEILNAFFENLGDGGDQFGGGQERNEDEAFEPVVEEITVAAAYDAVLVRFEEVEPDAEATAEPDADAEDKDEFNGEFIAYSIRLDDNRFVVMLVLTSELTYDEAQPTIDAMLDTLVFTP